MTIFEHRVWSKDTTDNSVGMTDQVVASFRGEEQRSLAYQSCPLECVVWEYEDRNEN